MTALLKKYSVTCYVQRILDSKGKFYLVHDIQQYIKKTKIKKQEKICFDYPCFYCAHGMDSNNCLNCKNFDDFKGLKLFRC
jgi:hypothetical protein